MYRKILLSVERIPNVYLKEYYVISITEDDFCDPDHISATGCDITALALRKVRVYILTIGRRDND